ncbi:MAG: class I SAM-dependent methyltransferase [Gammaproteobacteria bacterium]
MPADRTAAEARSPERIREHYLIERSLADRLRASTVSERRQLYRELYDELFRRVPDHSQIVNTRLDVHARHWRELALLRRLVPQGADFMELGAGDCRLALEVARWAGSVQAVDVSAEIVRGVAVPANFTLLLSNGCDVPAAPASVDRVFSNQLVEHLHPDDVHGHLRAVHEVLRPGGLVVILTPHRFTGPHDISRGFDDVATGFHLHEYTSAELARLLRDCGFRQVRQMIGAKGRYVAVPPAPIAALEALVEPLPARLRRAIGNLPGLRMTLHRLMMTARKPG